MNRNRIHSIIKKLSTGVASHARDAKDFDQEHIHDFRVSVKSMRSLLRLLASVNADSNASLPKKVRLVYHVAGAIRQAQVQVAQLGKLQLHLPGYTAHLAATTLAHQQAWNKAFGKTLFDKAEKKLCDYDYPPLHPSHLSAFLKQKIASILALANGKDTTDEDIHEIRKHIKDILYLSKIAGKYWHAARKCFDPIPIKELSMLADEIGDYNDERLLVADLAVFAPPGPTDDEASLISGYTTQQSAVLIEQRQRILDAVRIALIDFQ